MLTIFGKPHGSGGFCDGCIIAATSSPSAARSPAALVAAATCSRAEAQPESRQSHKAIINVFLPGGPPHQDMWDLKPDAPREIRGEFKPIKTNVPGIEICEHFPQHRRR